MSDAVLLALLSGPIVLGLREGIAWLRGRRKDDADAGLTTGQTWQAIVSELRSDISDLRGRVDALELDLAAERAENTRLRHLISRYRSVIRSLLRHVSRLREALAAANAEVPVLPQDVEDVMTDVEMSD